MDITDVILNDHHDQRRMFALLDETSDAIYDHKEIRDAITNVGAYETGSAGGIAGHDVDPESNIRRHQ